MCHFSLRTIARSAVVLILGRCCPDWLSQICEQGNVVQFLFWRRTDPLDNELVHDTNWGHCASFLLVAAGSHRMHLQG